jgi:hypothetical protein
LRILRPRHSAIPGHRSQVGCERGAPLRRSEVAADRIGGLTRSEDRECLDVVRVGKEVVHLEQGEIVPVGQ